MQNSAPTLSPPPPSDEHSRLNIVFLLPLCDNHTRHVEGHLSAERLIPGCGQVNPPPRYAATQAVPFPEMDEEKVKITKQRG
jgi:hypothetical protein